MKKELNGLKIGDYCKILSKHKSKCWYHEKPMKIIGIDAARNFILEHEYNYYLKNHESSNKIAYQNVYKYDFRKDKLNKILNYDKL